MVISRSQRATNPTHHSIFGLELNVSLSNTGNSLRSVLKS
ncbi:hypothetical protein ACHAXM_011885 [Skeletonema potamos]